MMSRYFFIVIFLLSTMLTVSSRSYASANPAQDNKKLFIVGNGGMIIPAPKLQDPNNCKAAPTCSAPLNKN